jgi:hypothetical protein
MSDNWIVQILQNALDAWNGKLGEIWKLVTMSPKDFRGGGIWNVVEGINGAVVSVGLALLVLFFLVGVVKQCGAFSELKRPEVAVRLFVRFIVSKAVITHGLELMMALFSVVQGLIATIMKSSGVAAGGSASLPKSIASGIEGLGLLASIPLWLVSLIASLVMTVLSFVMILTVYGRFFKLYIYTAIAPVPLSTFAGEPTQSIGVSFLRSYAAVLLEGAVIVLACVIYSLFAASPPSVDSGATVVTQVWSYVGETVFSMLILVGTVKMADRVVREMMGL